MAQTTLETYQQNTKQDHFSVFDMINPVSNLKTQYAGGIWSYPTYWKMATKGTFNYDPFFSFNIFSTIVPIKEPIKKFLPSKLFNNRVTNSIGSFFNNAKNSIGLTYNIEEGFTLDYRNIYNKNKRIDNIVRIIQRNKTPFKPFSSEDFTSNKYFTKAFDKAYKFEKKTAALERIAMSRRIALGLNISRIGTRFLGPLGLALTTADVVSLTVKGVGYLYDTAQSVLDKAVDYQRKIAKVDFNNNLNAGYLTRGAYTERQLAIQALSRNPGLAQRFVGNEAAYYSR